jgi:hypothetical protein
MSFTAKLHVTELSVDGPPVDEKTEANGQSVESNNRRVDRSCSVFVFPYADISILIFWASLIFIP